MTGRPNYWRLGLAAALLSTLIGTLAVAHGDAAHALPQSSSRCYAVSGPKDLRPASTTTVALAPSFFAGSVVDSGAARAGVSLRRRGRSA